ncbi:hypothetical protein TcWFU_009086 [Taenia crassiceps]|uniref:C2H2-type domain-containing protein n=1 Tax=Taenia crassiceps TaxID=6207 RepID=A0ABR4PZQ2_9CEST
MGCGGGDGDSDGVFLLVTTIWSAWLVAIGSENAMKPEDVSLDTLCEGSNEETEDGRGLREALIVEPEDEIGFLEEVEAMLMSNDSRLKYVLGGDAIENPFIPDRHTQIGCLMDLFCEKKADGGYKCGVCKAEHNNVDGLQQHLLRHSNCKFYLCMFCFEGFNTLLEMERHIATHADENAPPQSGPKHVLKSESPEDPHFSHCLTLKRPQGYPTNEKRGEKHHCVICRHSFDRFDALIHHTEKEHPTERDVLERLHHRVLRTLFDPMGNRSDNADTVKRRKVDITGLRPDLVERLCKYLSVIDIVNVCTAIPTWEWILFLQTPHSYISKWTWIDRRVYTTLYSDAPTPRTADICKAVEQHFNQMQFDLQFSLFRAPVDFRLPANAYFYPPGSAKFQLVGSELKKKLRSRRARCAAFNCVLYALELSLFTEHTFNVVIELQAIMSILSPKQTFGIVILDDVKKEEASGMDLFMDYAKKLGFVKDSPLMLVPVNWRIWHVQKCGNHIIEQRDIFEWACRDVIWRRMQEWSV